eukprot:4514259-Pyramimonas_sp.AAC.1
MLIVMTAQVGALQTLQGAEDTAVAVSMLLSLLHKLVGEGPVTRGGAGGAIMRQGANTAARLHLYAALLSYLQHCAAPRGEHRALACTVTVL